VLIGGIRIIDCGRFGNVWVRQLERGGQVALVRCDFRSGQHTRKEKKSLPLRILQHELMRFAQGGRISNAGPTGQAYGGKSV